MSARQEKITEEKAIEDIATKEAVMLKATVMGIDVEVEKWKTNDFELVELLGELEGTGEMQRVRPLLDIIKYLFNDWESVRQQLTDIDGRLPVSKFNQFVSEVFGAFNLKN